MLSEWRSFSTEEPPNISTSTIVSMEYHPTIVLHDNHCASWYLNHGIVHRGHFFFCHRGGSLGEVRIEWLNHCKGSRKIIFRCTLETTSIVACIYGNACQWVHRLPQHLGLYPLCSQFVRLNWAVSLESTKQQIGNFILGECCIIGLSRTIAGRLGEN